MRDVLTGIALLMAYCLLGELFVLWFGSGGQIVAIVGPHFVDTLAAAAGLVAGGYTIAIAGMDSPWCLLFLGES